MGNDVSRFVMIGHENYVNADLIAVILKPDSSPVKRLRQFAEERGMLQNACSGHKTRSVIVLSSGQVVLSSLQPMAIKTRIDKGFKEKERG